VQCTPALYWDLFSYKSAEYNKANIKMTVIQCHIIDRFLFWNFLKSIPEFNNAVGLADRTAFPFLLFSTLYALIAETFQNESITKQQMSKINRNFQ
jgi:hypothetical protein